MSSYSRQQLEKWIKEIPSVKGKVLDIGGSQNPVAKRLADTAVCVDEYKILDLEVPHETKVKPDIVCDLNKVLDSNQPAYCCDSFDVAFCLEVSEYWWNPVQAMKNVNFFLKKGGILYISFHFIYPIHNPLGEDYMRYTEFGVEKLLKETGFEMENLQYRTAKELFPIIFYQAEQMRPSRDYDRHNVIGYLVKAKKI